MNETLSFLPSIICSCVRTHDGGDVRMLDRGDLWHFSILGWEHHIAWYGATVYHERCASGTIAKMYRPIKQAYPPFFLSSQFLVDKIIRQRVKCFVFMWAWPCDIHTFYSSNCRGVLGWRWVNLIRIANKSHFKGSLPPNYLRANLFIYSLVVSIQTITRMRNCTQDNMMESSSWIIHRKLH